MSNSQSENTPASEHHKILKIFVNGREETVHKSKLTYEEVVALAYPNPNFQDNTYKVTYFRKDDEHHGHHKHHEHEKHEGVLTKGESVEITDCMVFTVIRALRS